MFRRNKFREPNFGGGAPSGGFRIGPGGLSPFIKWMLVANVAIFILQLILGLKFTRIFWLDSNLFFDQFPNYIYQMFTYMFLHGGFFHLFFNMFMLWMFGTEIEFTWGSRTFGKFYLIGGLAGGFLTLLVYAVLPASTASTLGASGTVVGASGAISSVFIAYWMMFPNRYLYIWFLFPVKVKWAIPALLLLSFFFSGPGVAHMAHLGGIIWGFLYLKSDWRLPSLSRKVKNLRYKRQEAKLNKKRQEAEDIMKKVDAILDKINEVGIENLTKAERKFLEEASSELSREKDTQK